MKVKIGVKKKIENVERMMKKIMDKETESWWIKKGNRQKAIRKGEINNGRRKGYRDEW